MKISLKWLGDYVNSSIPLANLVDKLTLAGLEVGEVKVIGGSWSNISIAKVIGINPHPNADRLRLATVDLGGKESTVVCGAPNLQIGDMVAFAGIGANLMDAHSGELVTLKPAKIRGVVSEGMICSEKELGISDNHEGILILPADAPLGTPLSQYLGDTILDIDVTPNRPDCLSVIGIAREVAALTGSPLSMPVTNYEESGTEIDKLASIKIIEPELCPRYCASLLTNVKIRPSPRWLQQRLLASGMRPINNVVDATNYVMLEYGQPLHAFDFDKIRGKQIIVRRANEGEYLTTLDGARRTLKSSMLVISDRDGAIAVAGVMGGSDSEVTNVTSTILIESANFNRAVVHGGSIDLKLSSEASSRFEKGISTELAYIALRRATQLMAELTDGRAAKGTLDIYPGKRNIEPILLPAGEIKRILGIEMTATEIVGSLRLLGFNCSISDLKEVIKVDVPWWRTDISFKADLVEEVARVFGYESIPTSMLASALPVHDPLPILDLRKRLRAIMVTCGFQEILTYSLTNSEVSRRVSAIHNKKEPESLRLANPMSKELEFLRTTLRPGILSTLARNQRYQLRGCRLFELGKSFVPRKDDLPEEKETLCAILNSSDDNVYWNSGIEKLDFFIAKGVVETVLSEFRLDSQFTPAQDESLCTGLTATIMANGENVGVIGQVNPKILNAFDIEGAVFMIEFSVDKLLSLVSTTYRYISIPRYPSVVRDIALVVEEKINYQQIYDIVHGFPLVMNINLFDVYRGEQVQQGKKSLACRITYQSMSQTLSDEEVDLIQQRILEKLSKELGASLRI
jgi:phenylalanyl-tRNA synthetase beta chain